MSAFSALSAPVTRKLSFAKITENLSKHRSQIAKMRLSLSASSALVTCRESFAEITGSLSKRRFQSSVFLSLVSFEEITGNLSTISAVQGSHPFPIFCHKSLQFPPMPCTFIHVPSLHSFAAPFHFLSFVYHVHNILSPPYTH
ncbi:hypothetical protein TB2_006843 [Malus domestica]